jgi:2',3'-cyclic-nucleotide 2'-phosphodiesterase (5'-nucleotidase family)
VLLSVISLKPYGSDVTSIASKNGIIAAAIIDSLGKTENGKIVFFNASTLAYISQVKVGANPDMVTFSPDGKRVLVANEGEPNNDYTIDREGSISIINISNGVTGLTQANVQTAGFTQFNNQTIDRRIKITGRIQQGGVTLRNSTVAEDLEPEYIAISDDSQTAWATCQENNCIAEINIATATVTRLIPLGYKNHNLAGNGIDASDNGAITNIANYPVLGMYQPDAIAYVKAGGTNYLISANEGDVRADWGTANNEEIRFGNALYVVDTAKFGGVANVTAMKALTAMGRLNVTSKYGDFNNDGKFDSVFCYGARSFSIWNANTGSLVWDSKDEIEKRIALLYPSNFNASHTSNTKDNRSDDKGPEPEALTIGKIMDSTYAFIGLERIGGVMIYNITNPASPYFVSYINTRDFAVTPGAGTLATVGDLGPEGIVFVPAAQSPNGKDMLILSNEISGTVALIQLNSRSAFQMQILHSSDMESSVAAVVDAPNYAAVVDKLEDEHVNTLILSSGDNTLPGPFLSAGEDPSVQTALRSTASSYYKGTQAVRPAIGRPDIAIMNIIGFNASALGNHEFDLGTSELNGQIGVDIRSGGTDKRWIGSQFPYVSANLDFSQDVNLNYLYTKEILRDTAFKTSVNITANTQKKGIASSIIIDRSGQRIGIVGVTTQVLAKISSPGATTVKGPQVDNMPALAAILQPYIDSLTVRQNVNKVILLAHLQQIANEKALAPLLRDVDIIISGGNHAYTADGNDRLIAGHVATEKYPIRTTSKGGQPMVILNTTSEWKYVGRFVCDFDAVGELITRSLDSTVNGVYASDTAMVTKLYGTYASAFTAGTKGANVRTVCAAIGAVIVTKDGTIVGKSKVFLEGRRNLVRTEETNLGNISSDANLWYARKFDPQVTVSIKNGGGIRSAVGFVNSVGNDVVLEATQANPSANKLKGDISRLDIENSLRFNNKLVIVSTNAAGLKRLLEHGISATKPNATPGQFPQIGGVSFSYDTTKTTGNKIKSIVIIDSLGNKKDTILRNGKLVGDTLKVYKVVTLNFLANASSPGSQVGGDGYPFPAVVTARVDLDTAIKAAGTSTFAVIGSEQDAFAEYMLAKHNTASTAYNVRDTTIVGDTRIQLLNARPDGIFPPLSAFSLIGPATNARLTVKDNDTTKVQISWQGATSAVKYKWLAALPGGDFSTPIAAIDADNNGKGTKLTLTKGAISSLLGTLNIPAGDSVQIIWTVKASTEDVNENILATNPHNLKLVRIISLSAFNLIGPASNARLTVKDNDTTKVQISWQASTGAVNYKWLAALPGGDFSTPLVALDADNNGKDTKLTLTKGAISSLLGTLNVPAGDSVQIIWTVKASTADVNNNILATSPFDLKLVRLLNVGVQNSNLQDAIKVYPNPTNGSVFIETTLTSPSVFMLMDINGKLIKQESFVGNVKVALEELNAGVYFIKINTADNSVNYKVVKQ